MNSREDLKDRFYELVEQYEELTSTGDENETLLKNAREILLIIIALLPQTLAEGISSPENHSKMVKKFNKYLNYINNTLQNNHSENVDITTSIALEINAKIQGIIQNPQNLLEYTQSVIKRQKNTQGLLALTQSDWDKAKRFFTKNPSETKMPKKDNDVPVAFIKVGDVIYAKETGKALLGEGAFAKVKLVQTEAGEQFAVKVQGRGLRNSDDAEAKIMALIGVLQGEAERDYGKDTYKGKPTDKKLYTVMKRHEGDEMFKLLYTDKYATTRSFITNDEQNIILAIKAAESIQFLHSNNFIHADIKPENFMTNIKGDLITVGAIDFGFSMLLPDGEKSISPGRLKGSKMFLAPEILKAGTYSFASDIYALGVMFNEDLRLDLPPEFYAAISDDNPDNRPCMSEVLKNLYENLESLGEYQRELSPQAEEMIEKYKKNNQTTSSSNDQSQPDGLTTSRYEEQARIDELKTKSRDSRDKTATNHKPPSPDNRISQENFTKLKK